MYFSSSSNNSLWNRFMMQHHIGFNDEEKNHKRRENQQREAADVSPERTMRCCTWRMSLHTTFVCFFTWRKALRGRGLLKKTGST